MTILGPSLHAKAGLLVRVEPVSGRQDQDLIYEMQLSSGRIPNLRLSLQICEDPLDGMHAEALRYGRYA